jgi:hypothetical protein
VLATYNPSGVSFVHWVMAGDLPLKILVGLVLSASTPCWSSRPMMIGLLAIGGGDLCGGGVAVSW